MSNTNAYTFKPFKDTAGRPGWIVYFQNIPFGVIDSKKKLVWKYQKKVGSNQTAVNIPANVPVVSLENAIKETAQIIQSSDNQELKITYNEIVSDIENGINIDGIINTLTAELSGVVNEFLPEITKQIGQALDIAFNSVPVVGSFISAAVKIVSVLSSGKNYETFSRESRNFPKKAEVIIKPVIEKSVELGREIRKRNAFIEKINKGLGYWGPFRIPARFFRKGYETAWRQLLRDELTKLTDEAIKQGYQVERLNEQTERSKKLRKDLIEVLAVL